MSHITGKLWLGHEVALDPSTFQWGGSWAGATPERPYAYDVGLIKFAYDRLMAMGEPRNMLDIGANTGSFSLLPLFVLGMRCWSFEPQPAVCDVLLQNVALNGLRAHVLVEMIALSDYRGTALLHCSRKDSQSGLASLRDDHGWPVTRVGVTTLDYLHRNRYDWHDVSFVKIDVEGGEVAVLHGGYEFIQEISPALLIEYKHVGLAALGACLRKLGYQWQTLGHRDLYAWKKEEHAIT